MKGGEAKRQGCILTTKCLIQLSGFFPLKVIENWINGKGNLLAHIPREYMKKAALWRIDAFELWCWRTLECPLDRKIKPVNPKGNLSWIFIGGTDAEAKAAILWPSDAKNWLIGKDPDAGKDWSQEGKGMTGWDGWMAWPSWWTWVWASFGIWWWTGRPGALQSTGSQRVGHDRATELNWKVTVSESRISSLQWRNIKLD